MAACSIGYKCICCGISVERSDSRRKVFGPSSTSLLLLFEDFIQRALPRINYLPADRSRLYWCLKCFAKLGKVAKLRKEVKRLDDEILNDISSFGKTLGLQIEAEENETAAEARAEVNIRAITPTRANAKRRLDWSTENQSRQKRMKPDTPENETLSRTIVTDTPKIALTPN